MSNYKEFLTRVRKYGLASPNRFKVYIDIPRFSFNQIENVIGNLSNVNYFFDYGLDYTSVPRNLSLMVADTDLPAKGFFTTDNKIYGPEFKTPYQQVYGDLNFTFYVDNEMIQKKFFDAWYAMIVNPTTNDYNFYNEYTTSIEIEQSDKDDNPLYRIRLREAYPVFINTLPLSHELGDTYHKLNVTFAYRKWEPVFTNPSTLPSIL